MRALAPCCVLALGVAMASPSSAQAPEGFKWPTKPTPSIVHVKKKGTLSGILHRAAPGKLTIAKGEGDEVLDPSSVVAWYPTRAIARVQVRVGTRMRLVLKDGEAHTGVVFATDKKLLHLRGVHGRIKIARTRLRSIHQAVPMPKQRCLGCDGLGVKKAQLACRTCAGKKRLKCQKCKRGKQTDCPSHSGDGCRTCLGTRKVIGLRCRRCAGKGYIARREVRINATGAHRELKKYDCGACLKRGFLLCKTCLGPGTVPCQPCGETGLRRAESSCLRCNGSGVDKSDRGVLGDKIVWPPDRIRQLLTDPKATSLQRDLVWKRLKGKKLRWVGNVLDVRMLDKDRGVLLDVQLEDPEFQRLRALVVYPKGFAEQLASVRKGKRLHFSGTLRGHRVVRGLFIFDVTGLAIG